MPDVTVTLSREHWALVQGAINHDDCGRPSCWVPMCHVVRAIRAAIEHAEEERSDG